MKNSLDSLLDEAKDKDTRTLIHKAFNLGLEEGVKHQQGRCGKCKLWDGLRPMPDFQEMRRKLREQ